MIDIRAGILAITICLIIFAVDNRPRPVRDNQIAYCVVDKRVASKDAFGVWHFGWGEIYAPCDQQDIYRNI